MQGLKQDSDVRLSLSLAATFELLDINIAVDRSQSQWQGNTF